MSVLLFAPSGDDPLRGTRWIAEQTQNRLANLGVSSRALFDHEATRERLEEHLGAPLIGLVAACHGGENQLLGAAREPVVDEHNAHRLAGKWVHAIACQSGLGLAQLAVDRGAACFAAYIVSLIVEWDPTDIPEPVRAPFARLVTEVSIALSRGVRDLSAIIAAILADQEAVIGWCDEHPDQANGLEITAQQLVSKLILVLPDPAS